jgi:hypothetical protein
MKVHINDLVFILGQGSGRVTRVLEDGSFYASVREGGAQLYSAFGTLGTSPIKRVYLYDPIIVDPPSNYRLWFAFKTIAKTLYEELVKLDASGDIGEPPEEVNGELE